VEARGRRFGDLAFVPAGDDFLVSARFCDAYRTHNLSGLEPFEPVEVISVKRKKQTVGEPPRYMKATVARGTTKIDIQTSGLEHDHTPTCSHCLSAIIVRWRRTMIDESTWSGADIVVPIGLRQFVVTERFKDACEANDIANAVFVPAEESGYDFNRGD
jgi:hypothetical protein